VKEERDDGRVATTLEKSAKSILEDESVCGKLSQGINLCHWIDHIPLRRKINRETLES